MVSTWFRRPSWRYSPLRQSSSTEYLNVESYRLESNRDREKPRTSDSQPVRDGHISGSRQTLLFLLNCFILSLSIGIWVTVIVPHVKQYSGRNALLKQTTGYSPLLDKIDIPFVTKRMNSTLVDLPVSPWRADPSDEADAAWLVAENPHPFAITREEVIALGQDPGKAVKWPETMGLGTDMYVARLEVFHQIHCLDAVRREVFFDYYYGEKYPDGYESTGRMHKAHLTHCIAYLMEHLMCSASVEVYTHFWTDAFPQPHPEFQIDRKCRDFDAILDWQQMHAVDKKLLEALRWNDAPGMQPPRKMSREFKDIFRYYETHVDDGSDWDGVDA